MSRRREFISLPALLAVPAGGKPEVSAEFPTQEPALAREVVGVSHGNIKRLKELVDVRPTLAKAAWDWGFGDWETALGAASHVGNREIALYLIEKGAPPTIFSATMLGQIDAVKAFVLAHPGVQRQKGPHSITLLSHARAGGAQAREVLEYLQSLGGADERLPLAPLSEEEKSVISGTYVFGPGPEDRMKIADNKGQLTILRLGGSPRNIFHLGSLAFYPAGAEWTRINVKVDAGKATGLSIHDPGPVLAAQRAAE